MQDIDAILAVADHSLRIVRNEYPRSLHIQALSPIMQAFIKNALENQRSALDYLAWEIAERFGDGGTLGTYYPMAQNPEDFPDTFENKLPRVATRHPSIYRRIERFQPYNRDWLKNLSTLVRYTKHRYLMHHEQREDDWWFVDINAPVLATLNEIQWGVNEAVDAIYEVADLTPGIRVSDVISVEMVPAKLRIPIRDYDVQVRCRVCGQVQLLAEAFRSHPDRKHTEYGCAGGCGVILTVRPADESARGGYDMHGWSIHGTDELRIFPQDKPGGAIAVWIGPQMPAAELTDEPWQATNRAIREQHPPPFSGPSPSEDRGA